LINQFDLLVNQFDSLQFSLNELALRVEEGRHDLGQRVLRVSPVPFSLFSLIHFEFSLI